MDGAPPRPGKLKRISEASLQSAVTTLLQLDGWRALRTDPVSNRGLGKGFGEIGMADYLYIRYGFTELGALLDVRIQNAQIRHRSHCEVLWIEHKAPGAKPSTAQQLWHAGERSRGALALIAGIDFEASIEGWQAWYKASGLGRK